MRPRVRVSRNSQELARRAAEHVCALVQKTLSARPRFSLALSGGQTPRLLYERLARPPLRGRIPWSRVHVFWGDERWVPPRHPDSNQGAARRAFLGKVPVPRANVHPFPVHAGSPAAAARSYERTLRRFFGPGRWPRFDLVILGLGEDGHTASLFPGSPGPAEKTRWAAAVDNAPKPPRRRLTLTLPVLNNARHVMFLASGASKKHVLRRVLRPTENALPAQRVRPRNGSLVWFADRAALPARRSDR